MNVSLRSLILVGSGAAILAGCGGSSNSTAFTPNLTFGVDLTSASNNLKTLNGGAATTGWNQLVGSTTVSGASLKVELLATVTYVNGSGPFTGVANLTYPDGSVVTLKLDGLASYNPTSTTTTFSSSLKVLGGTATHAGATGVGAFTGSRNTALGGPVHLDFQIALS